MKITIRPLALAALLVCSATASVANASASWIDWTSSNAGTLTIGSNVINVSLSGTASYGIVDGDYYYNNGNTGGTALSGTYQGLVPSDMVQVNLANTFTLTFDQAIVNPYIALVSVGQPGVAISYTFNGPIASLSTAGDNYWGTGTGSFGGNAFTGYEYNGVLQLSGAYTSLTITTAPNENWHGFNVGTVTAVPEPETYALLLAGLGLVGAIARRRKASV
jgi:hypothetical protein